MSSLRERIESGLGQTPPRADPAVVIDVDERPLRAELFSVGQLEQHARSLSAWHRIGARSGRGADRLLARLDDNETSLREAHGLITLALEAGTRITPAAEWFVDNYYLIEEQIRTARRHLPRGYSRELPRLVNGRAPGTPRVYEIALELISHAHGRLDLESLRAFVAAYQLVSPLRLGELWAIPIMLRLALLENLRREVASVTAGRQERERAAYWVEQMLEVGTDPAKVVLILADLVKTNPLLTNPFVAEFANRLQGQGAALVFPITWLEQRLAAQGQTIEQVFQMVGQSQAADQVSIGNSIGSLRLLGATDWRDFVEAMSVVERTLRSDPRDVYAAMDFTTRDRYRMVVEAIAKRSPLDEAEVAQAAVDLAADGRSRTDVPPGIDAALARRQAHVGYFLIDDGREVLERTARMRRGPRLLVRRLARRGRFAAYAGSIILLTGLLTALPTLVLAGLGLGRGPLVAVALALAASQLALGVVHWAVTLLLRPVLLPRLDFSAGIPEEHRTVVGVPVMLTDLAEIDGLLEALEVRFLANRDRHLSFALLSDFRDAPVETLDADAPLLARARDGIAALNTRYGGQTNASPFFLFHRARRWNPREGVWMGWERKRGKLQELNEALRGAPQAFAAIVGDQSALVGVKYVIVLDSDTQLPRGCAQRLAGTLAHPLNRPCYDDRRGRVTVGYAILQPRVATTMASAGLTRFSRLFAGEAGIDPYTRAVSDVYQDLFSEGSFVGKGIYDVDAFEQALAGRLPENRVLSHDLLEGAYARAGLVSDVTLFDDYPSAYLVDVSRRHRWMRGDWQIAGWLRRRVPAGSPVAGAAPRKRTRNPLSLLSQWKVLDNLRRSLVPIALLTLLVLGWATAGATEAALVVTLAVATVLLLPGLLAAAAEVMRRPSDLPRHRHLREIGLALGRQALREVCALAALPYDAWIASTAVLRTVGRMLVGRKLLEWRTASDAQRGASSTFLRSYGQMWIAPVVAAGAASVLAMQGRGALLVAAPILVLWAAAPAMAWWSSQPVRVAPPRLDADELRFLHAVARRTWRFFEAFVTVEDNHLPPDNFQQHPPVGLAHRTSPTNIGLCLTANLAAYDFGYVTASELFERTTLTLRSLEKLPRYRGHFYNWYDTRSLEPLRPLYVSTVDSGNLAGHLLTLAVGLGALATQPIVSPRLAAGLRGTLEMLASVVPPTANIGGEIAHLREQVAREPATLTGALRLLEAVSTGARDLGRGLAVFADDREVTWWLRALERQCERANTDLAWFAPWVAVHPPIGFFGTDLAWLDVVPTLDGLTRLAGTVQADLERTASQGEQAAGSGEHGAWVQAVGVALRLAAERAATRLGDLGELAARCREASEGEYDFLYDRDRDLLTIGYNVADHRPDSGFYDLLASEARLGSFVAIAQGKLPQEHWFSLGRSLTSVGGEPALLSWSGSMFEYLMPLLLMPTYEGTILEQTYHGVVERQIAYGRQCRLPWGVSESGYNKTDAHANYQYRAFGVPGLGFKRGLAEDRVVAPYASAMALMVAPEAACANLMRLADDGALGSHGFFEAIDCTPARLPRGKEHVIVRSYMAHHQGMTFLSLAYLLLDRPMQRRFMAEPAFQATDLLLQERVPRVPVIHPHPAEVAASGEAVAGAESTLRVFATADTASPSVHLLSNGRYHVAVTNAGGGYSRWRELAVTRWHEDPTRDCWGSFCYLRDVGRGAFWSVAHHPSLARAERYEAIFSQGRAEFRRRDHGIDTHVEISVSPEDDVELRRISLTNNGETPRQIELTSFAEVVLAQAAADAAHPAFSNLFVQTELLRERQAILCTRRPRSGPERPPWMLHLMIVQGTQVGATSYETAREAFIGRGRSAVDPRAMHEESLGDSEGAVLDPVVAIRNTVLIQPDETVRVHIVTGVAETRAQALALIEKYGDRHAAERVFDLSWTHNQVVLRQLDATDAEAQIYERLASNVLYANPALRAPRSVIARNRRGQSALWAYGISGDVPIVLVRIASRDNLSLVRQMARAHAYWRLKGLQSDLVIWNEDASGYRQVLHEEIMAVVGTPGEGNVLDRPGGVFVRRSDQLTDEDKVLMQTVARVIVSDAEGSLLDQLNRRAQVEMPPPLFPGRERRREAMPPGALAMLEPLAGDRAAARADASATRGGNLTAFNGLGGFTPDGREYVITTTAGRRTPAPWVNVLANPWFGTVVSESGGAYTWCENAHSYRLTPWHNDPVSDASGEALYLRDEMDGRFWSPTPLPAGGPSPYKTRHGFGYSVFEHREGGVATELGVFVATDAPVKFLTVKIKNQSGRARSLSLSAYFELVLGSQRPANAPHVVTEVDAGTGGLLGRNAYGAEFAPRVVFLGCSEGNRSVTGDRTEFLGRNGTTANPACMTRVRLSGRVGAGLDPCLAMQVSLDLADGQEHEVVFTFGSGRDLADARTLLHRFAGTGPARAALEGVWAYWNRTLGTVNVQTPDASLDHLANGWLLYQVLASRIWGRSGFYQSGGAFGFRDQLQDAMALVHAEPGILRQQIVRAASRQFGDGDVQHWWHPPTGRGVRTRISDDYLWLPHAACRYVAALGDTGVLDELVPFLEGRPVQAEEDSYYDLPQRSEVSGTVYEHCVRAIERGLRLGAHGLPLMGSGDWNDGMNLVGDQGQGESVWLAFFLHDVLTRFGDLARRRGDGAFADRCAAEAARLRDNIEQHGWDGAWYRRAYFDSGAPLGSSSNPECQIDSIPQSWAVLSGAAPAARAREALASLDQRLVRRDLGLIALFDPPFDSSDLKPGYVKGYVPGVRENGGQYTHAAIWAIMAFAEAGDVERAWELFRLVNPIRHGASAAAIATYKVEPYVVAADVYTNPQHAGRGGWTWYTGSAGWMYRLIVESLLGVRLEVDRLRVAPLMPRGWSGFRIHYRHHQTVYHIHVRRPADTEGQAVTRVLCDGVDQADGLIPLENDQREHHVDVELGEARRPAVG